jgi:hypothetical protein
MNNCSYSNCTVQRRNLQDLLLHIKAAHEKDSNFKIKCVYSFCRVEFNSMKNLIKHIEFSHQNLEPRSIIKYCCGFENTCLGEFENLVQMKRHLYEHIRLNNKEYYCIFKNCFYASDKAENFKMHFTRTHSACDELKERFVKRHNDVAQNNVTFDEEMFVENNGNEYIEEDHIPDYCAELEKFYMKAYLKYTAKNMIPDKHVNEIFDDIAVCLDIYKKLLISKLKENFNSFDIMENGKEIEKKKFFEKFESFLNYYSIYDYVHKNYKSENSKFKWVENSKHYVEPRCFTLPDNNEYHYVPILKTLSSILTNDYLKEQYFKNVPSEDSNRIMGFEDSLAFKRNPLFRSCPNAVQIRIYLDDFNLANPLGDAKNNLKYTCVYFR